MTIELAQKDEPKAGPIPREILAWFKRKKIKPSMDYREVWQQEHSFAFTVAKLTEISLLDTVQKSITKAIEEGTPMEVWRDNIEPMLEQSGWREHVSEAQKPHRLRVIYDTNMRTARANGQADRIKRTAKVLPYLKYELGPSKNHRPEHVAWAGLILPADDDFWKEHFPPNSYGCFLPDTRIDGAIIGGSKAWYSGEAVEIELKSGARLSVTVNHPIATPKGWVSAGALRVGDDCLSNVVNGELPILRTVDDQQGPALVQDVFDALAAKGKRATLRPSVLDFHGEARRFIGEIEVVGSYVQLANEDSAGPNDSIENSVLGGASLDPSLREKTPASETRLLVGSFDVSRSSNPCGATLPDDIGPCAPTPQETGSSAAAAHVDTLSREPIAERGATDIELSSKSEERFPALVSRQDGLVELESTSANHKTATNQMSGESAAAYAKFIGELCEWRAGIVSIDEIVRIRKFDFSGHVFDLESATGWLFADGVVASNCKCRVRQISRREADESGGPSEAPEEERVEYELPDGRTGTAPKGVHPSFAYPMGSDGREAALDDALKSAKKTKK